MLDIKPQTSKKYFHQITVFNLFMSSIQYRNETIFLCKVILCINSHVFAGIVIKNCHVIINYGILYLSNSHDFLELPIGDSDASCGEVFI